MQDIEAGKQKLTNNNPSLYLSDEVWEKVQGYLIPNDHPIKEKLDQIFSNSRVLENEKSMLAAGFETADQQSYTKVVVTRHPKLPGYIIKAYLDTTRFGPKGRHEHEFLIRRIIGARLVQESIMTHGYENLLKVPEKWLYLLPDEPSPYDSTWRKMFILIEDDMDIYNDKKTERLWGSEKVTEELLEAVYTVVTEVGLSDSTKPSNCPFSKDGRVAFIDTQMYNRAMVKYDNLTPFLSPSKQIYWINLIRNRNR